VATRRQRRYLIAMLKNGKTGRRQQLTRQLITARVQVMANTLHRTHAAHFPETCIWLQRWREANVYTVTRSPGCPPASSSAAALERTRPVESDHRGRGAGWVDAVTRPSYQRGALWRWVVSRVVTVRGLLSCIAMLSGSSFNYDLSVAAAAWVFARR